VPKQSDDGKAQVRALFSFLGSVNMILTSTGREGVVMIFASRPCHFGQ